MLGSALYVYGIVLGSREMDLVFFVDGAPAGNYTFGGGGAESYTYDAQFYVNSTLEPGVHYFLLQNGQGDGAIESAVLFDYLVYTT